MGRPNVATTADVHPPVGVTGEAIRQAYGTGVGALPLHYGGRPIGRRRRPTATSVIGDALSCIYFLIEYNYLKIKLDIVCVNLPQFHFQWHALN